SSATALKPMTVFPSPISRNRPAAGLSRICWMARRWYGYGLNFIRPPPYEISDALWRVNHVDLPPQRLQLLMPFHLKRSRPTPRRFQLHEHQPAARQEYQPIWRPCPPRRNEFQGLPAYPLHLLFQHSLDVACPHFKIALSIFTPLPVRVTKVT